ncbi:MAG: AraC family transcriptional regulator [Proteobacteria bacterium]|nr:AraC family transcriptional regulator [Pseudomonadota bacterium]
MSAAMLDVFVRAAAVALLLLLAFLLLRDRASRRLALLFAPLALCLCGFLAGNTPDPTLRPTGAVAWTAHLLAGYAAPFLWWFCLASFDPEQEIRGPVLFAGLGWLAIASADRGLLGPALAEAGLSWGLIALGLGMLAWLAWRLVGDREGDLMERRRSIRILVPCLFAVQLLLSFAKDLLLGFDWRPEAFTLFQNTSVLLAALALFALFVRADTALLRGTARAAAAPLAGETPAERSLAARLRTLMEVERAYLDPELSFPAFVARAGAPERTVRRFINHRLGHAHFRTYLNGYRVAEARRLLADPTRCDDKLIAIALDSGFASLASFNRVFRAEEGSTPSDYRAAQFGQKPPFEERSAGS